MVIAIIGVLAAMLLPAIAKARERARRANCASNMKQFILACHLYAGDHDDFLPVAGNDSVPEEACPALLSTVMRNTLFRYAGTGRILTCPNLGKPFDPNEGWYNSIGYVIGYLYLGGYANTPWANSAGTNLWVSPCRLGENSRLVLVADLNVWDTAGNNGVVVPHGPGGAVARNGRYNNPGSTQTSRQLGAAGGNVGYLDGSVQWKNVEQMETFTIFQADGYFGMW